MTVTAVNDNPTANNDVQPRVEDTAATSSPCCQRQLHARHRRDADRHGRRRERARTVTLVGVALLAGGQLSAPETLTYTIGDERRDRDGTVTMTVTGSTTT
jgi:hypothetical protein